MESLFHIPLWSIAGQTKVLLESWLIIPLFPVGILLGWGEGQMLICCVNLFIYFRLYKVPDGKL